MNNEHLGSSPDEFLKSGGIREEAKARDFGGYEFRAVVRHPLLDI